MTRTDSSLPQTSRLISIAQVLAGGLSPVQTVIHQQQLSSGKNDKSEEVTFVLTLLSDQY
jgi:hypothetical protein